MDTTSNSSSIQADSFLVWDTASKTYVNLQSSIVGLAPSTLDTLVELATAVGGNPNFASDLQATTSGLQTQLNAKADTISTYSKAAVDTLLLGKTDDAELTASVSVLNTSINTVSNAVGVVATAVGATYTKAAVDTLLLGKTDDAELTAAVSVLNTSINTVSTAVGVVATAVGAT